MTDFHNSFALFIIICCLSSQFVKTNSVRSVDDIYKSKMREKRQTTRVLNGEVVTPHEFPQLAHIIRDGKSRCSGTIVTKDWVICAAFCVTTAWAYVPDLSTMRVIVGHHNISVREVSEQNLSVVDVIVHERYKRTNLDRDLALIRVEPSIKFNSKVHPTNLPTCLKSPPPGTVATVVGVGKYIDDKSLGNKSDVPRKGMVTIRSYEECRKFPEYNTKWTRKNLCTFMNETSGPCDGDAGAPLFVWHDGGPDGKQKTLVQVGVSIGVVGAGGGQNCSQSSFLYADLSYYVGWIHRRVSGCGNFPFNTESYPGQPTFTYPPKPTIAPSSGI